ncbi:MAG: N-acetylmuramoyl-L-alanine amidase [Candidatus Eiseniibacteriota bacterium]|nr:MAG: N-acetylmuramoyl-L-alanine amidase [Candidatus Eisenbacteria bacterium]
MRRRSIHSLLVCLLLVAVSPSAASEARRASEIDGRYYVSINDAALLLGATKFWKVETRKAVLNVEGTRIRLTVGSPVVVVGDRAFVLTAPVLFRSGMPYVPVELFSDILPQVFQKRIVWNPANKTLSVIRSGMTPVVVSLEPSEELTYVTIESAERIDYSPISLSSESFIILLEDAGVAGTLPAREGGLVKKLELEEGGGRIAVRIRPDSRVVGYVLKRESGPDRIIIGFTSSALRMRALGFTPLGVELPRGMYRVVVLDPGHGGKDMGVRGENGTLEKNLTLQIAREARTILTRAGNLEVFLTRDDDSQQSLESRASRANALQGDIYVSIHCDGYPSSLARGYSIEVFKASGGLQSLSPRHKGGAVTLSSWQRVPEGYTRSSLALASALSGSLGATGLRELSVRKAPVLALEGVDMPSVLVNCGFLTSGEDESILARSSSRSEIAAAIAEGIQNFVRQGMR